MRFNFFKSEASPEQVFEFENPTEEQQSMMGEFTQLNADLKNVPGKLLEINEPGTAFVKFVDDPVLTTEAKMKVIIKH